jgi:hypothetical protein
MTNNGGAEEEEEEEARSQMTSRCRSGRVQCSFRCYLKITHRTKELTLFITSPLSVTNEGERKTFSLFSLTLQCGEWEGGNYLREKANTHTHTHTFVLFSIYMYMHNVHGEHESLNFFR